MQDIKDLLLKLKPLTADHNKNIDAIEAMVEEWIRNEPDNNNKVQALTILALIEQYPPLADPFTSTNMLERALALDENNITALLLLAFVHYYQRGGVDEALKNNLLSVHTNDPEVKSILTYAASWHYSGKDDAEHEKLLLLESIKLWDKHVWNHVHLAKLYITEGQKAKAKKTVLKALDNIVYVYSNECKEFDEINIPEFINAYIKGINITQPNLESIQELLKKASA